LLVVDMPTCIPAHRGESNLDIIWSVLADDYGIGGVLVDVYLIYPVLSYVNKIGDVIKNYDIIWDVAHLVTSGMSVNVPLTTFDTKPFAAMTSRS
jgi:hypothetical protein